MEAKNRKIEDWCGRIKRAEIKLPRFQRFEAWDRNRISGLLSAIIQEPSLPLGITLIMEVGDDAPFVGAPSRYLETAEPAAGGADGHIREYLLDGQQRLTALWHIARQLSNGFQASTFCIVASDTFLCVCHRAPQKHFALFLAINHRGKGLLITPLRHHPPRHIGCTVQNR